MVLLVLYPLFTGTLCLFSHFLLSFFLLFPLPPPSLSHSSPLIHFSLPPSLLPSLLSPPPQAQKAKLIAEGKLLGPKLAGAAAIAKKDENVEYEPFQFEDGAYEMAGEEEERGCLSMHSERKMMCF